MPILFYIAQRWNGISWENLGLFEGVKKREELGLDEAKKVAYRNLYAGPVRIIRADDESLYWGSDP